MTYSPTPSLIVSEDGSHTLYVEALDEHYHSTHGAIQESNHVFIEAGLKQVNNSLETIRIFEVGFGTGLNAFLSLLYAEENKKHIYYSSVELYPLNIDIAGKLNYANILSPDKHDLFLKLHSSDWNEELKISEYFTLNKRSISLENINITDKFNLIYFDAFAPEKQPELWTADIFNRMYDILLPGGILTTYCAKGQVRRNMIEAGFTVERIPGPPGKREIMRARKGTRDEGQGTKNDSKI